MSTSSDGSQARTQERRAVSFDTRAQPGSSHHPNPASVVIATTDPIIAACSAEIQRAPQITIPPNQYFAAPMETSQVTPSEYPFPVKPEFASPSPYASRDPLSASQYTTQSQQHFASAPSSSSLAPPFSGDAQARPASSNQLSMYAPLDRQMAQEAAPPNWLRGDVYGYGMTMEQIAMQQAQSPLVPARDAWLHEQPTQRQAYEQQVVASGRPQASHIPTYEPHGTTEERSARGGQPLRPAQAVPSSPQRQTTSASTSKTQQNQRQAQQPNPRTQPQSAAGGTAPKQSQPPTQKPSQAQTGQSQRQPQVQQSQIQRATQSTQTNTQPPNQTSSKPQASARSTAQAQVNGKLNASTASTAKAPTSANTDQRPAAITSNSQAQTRQLPDTALQPAATASTRRLPDGALQPATTAATRQLPDSALQPTARSTSQTGASGLPENNVAPTPNETSARAPLPPSGPRNGPSSSDASRPAWITANESPLRPRTPAREPSPPRQNTQPRLTLSDRPANSQANDSHPALERTSSSSTAPDRQPQSVSERQSSPPALAERIAPVRASEEHRRLWVKGLPHPCTEADVHTIWAANVQDRVRPSLLTASVCC
jgi:hypothetical protein